MKARHKLFIFGNMAMTLDGKVAATSHAPATFGSPEDRRRLLALRAQADAILVGARTAQTDHYAMGLPSPLLRKARLRRGQAEYPLRCVVSGTGHVEESLEIFQHDFSPIVIFTTRRMPAAKRQRLEQKAHLFVVGQKKIHWQKLLAVLHQEFHVRKLLIEGGPTLNYALLRENLFDELYVTLCPQIFGGRAAPTLMEGEGLPLAQARHVQLVSAEPVGNELFLRYRFVRRSQ